jgi:glucan phosphoethanolaminetransferase (alkaline phosphatase superfamily)
MSTEQDTQREERGRSARPAPGSVEAMHVDAVRVEAGEPSQGMTSAQWWWCLAVGVLLVVWFFIAWLALDRHVLDAAGESVGSGFALLVVVSVVGSLRGPRD